MLNKINNSASKFLVINLLLFAISLFFGAYYYWYRVNIDSEALQEVLITLSLASILFSLPDIICYYTRYNYRGMITIFVLMFFVLLGFIISINSILMIFFAFSLLVHQIIRFLKIIVKSNSKIFYSILSIILILIVGGSLVTTIYGQGYLHPLFLEKMALGLVHRDTLFHAAVCHLFENFYIPSTGLHGVQYLHYHYGSHVIFAGLAKLIDLNPIVFYNLAYPLIFIPFFFKAVFIAVFKIQDYIKNKTHIISVILIVFGVAIFIFPQIFNDGGQPFTSESNAIAILISLLFFSDIFLMIENLKKKKTHYLPALLYYSFAVIILVLTKVSVGYIFFAMISYLVWREFSLKNLLLWSFVLLNGVFIYFFYKAGDIRYSGEVYTIRETLLYNFGFFRKYAIWLGFIVITYLISKEIRLNRASFQLIKEDIKSKKSILIELMVVVSIISAVPSIILLSLNTNDVFYFVNYQFYIGMVIAIPYLLQLLSEINKKINHIELKIFTLFLLFYTYIFINDISPNAQIRAKLIAEKNSVILSSQDNKNYLFLKTLSSFKFEANSVMYVPKNNAAFWDMQNFKPLGAYCTIPAIAGLPQLYAIPYDTYRKDYGFSSYLHIQPPNSEEDVISEARRKGFGHLYTINEDLDIIKIDF